MNLSNENKSSKQTSPTVYSELGASSFGRQFLFYQLPKKIYRTFQFRTSQGLFTNPLTFGLAPAQMHSWSYAICSPEARLNTWKQASVRTARAAKNKKYNAIQVNPFQTITEASELSWLHHQQRHASGGCGLQPHLNTACSIGPGVTVPEVKGFFQLKQIC